MQGVFLFGGGAELAELKEGYRVLIYGVKDAPPWAFTVRDSYSEALDDLIQHNEQANEGKQKPFLFGKIEKIYYRH